MDAKGNFLAGVYAEPVYKLLGKKGLGTSEFPNRAVHGPHRPRLPRGTPRLRQGRALSGGRHFRFLGFLPTLGFGLGRAAGASWSKRLATGTEKPGSTSPPSSVAPSPSSSTSSGDV